MPSVAAIAEKYVERAAALDPTLATHAGIAGHDHELPDLSADGFAERARLDRWVLAALGAAEVPGPGRPCGRRPAASHDHLPGASGGIRMLTAPCPAG